MEAAWSMFQGSSHGEHGAPNQEQETGRWPALKLRPSAPMLAVDDKKMNIRGMIRMIRTMRMLIMRIVAIMRVMMTVGMTATAAIWCSFRG